VSGALALRTRVEERDGVARFVIDGADALAAEHLPHMGYEGLGDGRFATRWYRDPAEARRLHPRFAAAIEPMALQCARRAPVPWEDALLDALRRLDGAGLDWWLYGSAALAVRGLAVEPGDIDLHVGDPHRAGRLFDDLLVTPVERLDGWVARWVGRAFGGPSTSARRSCARRWRRADRAQASPRRRSRGATDGSRPLIARTASSGSATAPRASSPSRSRWPTARVGPPSSSSHSSTAASSTADQR
jgi:hypothetical protein